MSDYVQVPTRSLDYLENAIQRVNNKVDFINGHLEQVDQELEELKRSFIVMIKEQRQQAALQRAITEVIRVRQEVEQKFGKYQEVRDHMLGILQATDDNLVSAATILKSSEELMLNNSEYWLAPCLIALAAWIGNDQDLAYRAVNKALATDKEKTCLLFALVCRRNGRTKECFGWLFEYLKEQNPLSMTKSVIAFIDAYTNGVFGIDESNVCKEYIVNWIRILKDNNSAFDQQQRDFWKNFFSVAGASAAYQSHGYNCLKELSPEFGKIDGFVSRITAFNNDGGSKDQINNIIVAEVDKEQLIKEVDNELKKLVTLYETKEEALRDEETQLQLVKKYRGDEKRAKQEMDFIKYKRIDQPVDFASRLQQAVVDPGLTPETIAAKKTAIFLLREYIIDAYGEYITENKDTYPEKINLQVNDNKFHVKWSGSTVNGENVAELKKTLTSTFEKAKDAAILRAKPSMGKMIFAGVFTLGIGALVMWNKFKKTKGLLEVEYFKKSKETIDKLEAAVNARIETNKIVNEFVGRDDWDKIELKEAV